MRTALICVLVIIALGATNCWAKISVSPVVIEAGNVKEGDCFQIMFGRGGDEPVVVKLSLAQFERDQDGNIYFLEDEASIRKAREILKLAEETFPLDPNEQKVVEVQVATDDFSEFSGVLFAKSNQPGIPVRFAILFLLSARAQASGL